MKKLFLCLSLCFVLSAFGFEAAAAGELPEVTTTLSSVSESDEASTDAADTTDEQESTVPAVDAETTVPSTTQPQEAVKSGFVVLEDGLYYYIPGSAEKFVPAVAGVNVIGEKTYLVASDGKIMQYSAENPVVTFGKDKFCLNEDNTLFSGEKILGDKKYCFNKETYKLVTGWFTDENGKHYAGVKTGEMLTGLNKVGGKYYYFTPDTYAVKTGWVSFETGKRYFKSKTGVMLTGLNKVGGKYYFFNTSNGLTQKGWISTADGKRYFRSKDSVMLTGLNKIGGKYYYFNTSNGLMQTGWIKSGSKKRYFKSKTGVMLTGLNKVGGKYYYFNPADGYAKKGWISTADGKRYFGSKDFVMITGYKKVGGKYYYFNTSNGLMKSGWVTFSQGKRYFNSKGVMLTGLNKIGGKSYYFNSSGYMKTGLLTIGSDKYYFSPKTGVMSASSWVKVGSKEYYFSSNGKMAKNTIVGKEYVLSNGTKATSKAVKQAVSVVNAVTTKGMSKSEQLRACFNWIVRNCYYQRDYQNPATLKYDWTKTYAQYLFTNKCGNCYKYASAMAYCAKVLGYPSKVAYGKISSGNAMVAHGWVEITINGSTYILDPVQQDYSKGNYYMRTYSNYPKKLSKAGTRSIVLS